MGARLENALNKFQNSTGDIKRDEVESLFIDILKGTYEVCNKIEKIEARNDLLESSMLYQKQQEDAEKNKEKHESSESEDEDVGGILKNFGTRTAMEIYTDLVRDAGKFFSNKENKKLGYNISFKQYECLQFLQVNYTILTEEFNNMFEKMKEMKVFKVEYEKNKINWSKKVEASAGDVNDHVAKIN